MTEKKDIIGHLYDDLESEEYSQDIVLPFYKLPQTFEFYKCPKCNGQFGVESDAVENCRNIFCPYCGTKFAFDEDEKEVKAQ